MMIILIKILKSMYKLYNVLVRFYDIIVGWGEFYYWIISFGCGNVCCCWCILFLIWNQLFFIYSSVFMGLKEIVNGIRNFRFGVFFDKIFCGW